MTNSKASLDVLRQRLPADGSHFTLLNAIDAFEATYRSDPPAGDVASVTLAGWQGGGAETPYFELALSLSIAGEPFELPAIVTAIIRIQLQSGESFPTESDEPLTVRRRSAQGEVYLMCPNASAGEAFFHRVRGLPLVQKYGLARPITCELRRVSDDDFREICAHLLEHFRNQGCPQEAAE